MKNKSKKMSLTEHLTNIGHVFGGMLITTTNPDAYNISIDSLYENFPTPANDRLNMQNDRKAVGEDLKKAVEEKKKELV